MKDLNQKNWGITRITAVSVLTITVALVAYMIISSTMKPLGDPRLYAVAAGLIFALGARLGDIQRFKTATQPISALFNTSAGALLLASMFIFLPVALEIISNALQGFSGNSILSLVAALILPLFGFLILLLGLFMTSAGSVLVFWDKTGEKVPLGARKRDFIFTAIMAGLTVFGIIGTAFLTDLSLGNYISKIYSFLTSSSNFGTVIAGGLTITAYRAVRLAWKSLPIRESVPRKSRETYDKLKKPEKIVRLLILPLFAVALAISGFNILPALQPLNSLASPAARTLLLAAVIVSTTVFVAVKILKLVTSDFERVKKFFPYLAFGALVYFLAPLLTPFLDSLIGQLPATVSNSLNTLKQEIGRTQAVMMFMTIGSAAGFLLKSFMHVLRLFGLIPKGIEGTTVLASGIFFSTIGFHLNTPNALLLFTGVAVSMIIWELGKRSVVLGGEIGRSGSTYQAEIVQIVTKLSVAVFSILVAYLLIDIVSRINLPSPKGFTGTLVLLVTITGIGLLTASLKEFT